MHPYVGVLQTYMTALGQSDYKTVKNLFAPSGKVLSPFLGEMLAGPFFDRLAEASAKNVITPIDIFLSATDKKHATAYFQYDWTVRDGTLITFKVMDLFTFEAVSNEVAYLDLIYDTHPIRVSAGNKYELQSLRHAGNHLASPQCGLKSTLKCNTAGMSEEHFARCFEVQAQPGPVVQSGCDAVAVGLIDAAHAHALGQVLTNQTIGVLVGAALP
jgi:hypothetical protein